MVASHVHNVLRCKLSDTFGHVYSWRLWGARAGHYGSRHAHRWAQHDSHRPRLCQSATDTPQRLLHALHPSIPQLMLREGQPLAIRARAFFSDPVEPFLLHLTAEYVR